MFSAYYLTKKYSRYMQNHIRLFLAMIVLIHNSVLLQLPIPLIHDLIIEQAIHVYT